MASHHLVAGNARIRVWDLPLRLFHWLLVASIALAFLSAEEESALNDWHILAGWVAAILIAFRLAWGFVGGEHSRFADFLTFRGLRHHLAGLAKGKVEPTLGHNPLGSVAVVLMLLLIALTVWSGALLGEAGEELHELVAWTLLGLLAVHILAVVLTSLLSRENLVKAMIDGSKPSALHPGAFDARRPRVASILLAILVVAGAVYAVTRYDPAAFSLRSAEAFEHRLGDGGEAGKAHARDDDEE